MDLRIIIVLICLRIEYNSFNSDVHYLCETKIVKLIDRYSIDIYIYYLICDQLIELIFIDRIMMVVTGARTAGITRKLLLFISVIFVPIIIMSLIQTLKDKIYKKNNVL